MIGHSPKATAKQSFSQWGTCARSLAKKNKRSIHKNIDMVSAITWAELYGHTINKGLIHLVRLSL